MLIPFVSYNFATCMVAFALLGIERAQDFVEKQYERLKNQGGQFGREKLLTLLVLGVADDLLQTQQQLDGVETRLANLLELIEKTD